MDLIDVHLRVGMLLQYLHSWVEVDKYLNRADIEDPVLSVAYSMYMNGDDRMD